MCSFDRKKLSVQLQAVHQFCIFVTELQPPSKPFEVDMLLLNLVSVHAAGTHFTGAQSEQTTGGTFDRSLQVRRSRLSKEPSNLASYVCVYQTNSHVSILEERAVAILPAESDHLSSVSLT